MSVGLVETPRRVSCSDSRAGYGVCLGGGEVGTCGAHEVGFPRAGLAIRHHCGVVAF